MIHTFQNNEAPFGVFTLRFRGLVALRLNGWRRHSHPIHIHPPGLRSEFQRPKVHLLQLFAAFPDAKELTGSEVLKDLYDTCSRPFNDQFIDHFGFADPYFLSKGRASETAAGIDIPVDGSFRSLFGKADRNMRANGGTVGIDTFQQYAYPVVIVLPGV